MRASFIWLSISFYLRSEHFLNKYAIQFVLSCDETVFRHKLQLTEGSGEMDYVKDFLALPWEHKDLKKLWRWPIARYLNTFGWWAEDYDRPVVQFIFKIIRIVFFSVNVVFLMALTIGVGQQMASTPNVMDNLFSFFAAGPSFVGFGKIIGLMSQRKMWRKIWKNLDDMLHDVVNRGVDAELEAEIRWRYKRCWAMYSIFLSVGTCITLHWLVRPIVYAIYGERTSIVDTWPTYLNTWLQWFTTYVFQAMNISSFGHSLYLYDNVYFCTCENILVQFAILKHNLYMMDISKGKPGGVNLDFCIIHHNKLIDVCMELRKCTKEIILQQIFWTVLILCPGVFELASGKQTDATILFNLLEITAIMTIILYFYSWYSNEVTYQCDQIYKACYMSDWIKGNTAQRRTLLTMMTRSMKSIIFGGLVQINLSTFVAVLKTTFSYYQFLVTIDKRKEETT